MIKTVIESIREYFDNCPLLKADAKLNLDYLGLEDVEYGIYSEPVNPIIKKYVDGDELKQHTFVFAVKNLMSDSYITQLENISFFDRFIQWVEQNNKQRKLPQLEGKRQAQRLEILTNGYLIAQDEGKAQYQIQMRLIYKEEY
nr:MAG TPA: Minor capsid protein from bacteriophage [Caudoviricetes sp.]